MSLTHSRSQTAVFLVAVAAVAAPGSLEAQPAPKAARAVRIAGPVPRVDGSMDEAIWATAVPITDFVAKLPVEGARPSVGTEVRILYDTDALYVGARMSRPDPQNIPTAVTRRDGTSNAESLVLSFDTYLDRRTA